MKLLSRFLAVGVLLTVAQSFAASTFEGKVSLAITAERGRTMNMDYSLKGQKVRMDLSAEGNLVSSIMDLGKMEMLMLMPDQQMYMVIPMQQKVEQAMERPASTPRTSSSRARPRPSSATSATRSS